MVRSRRHLGVNRQAKTARVSSLRRSAGEVRDFETLLPELARSLVRAPVNDLDAEIDQWLERIATSLGYDRGTLTQINPVTGLASFTNSWARPSNRRLSSSLDVKALLPWTLQTMLIGETVVMPSPKILPREAAVDSESFSRHGTKSNVMAAIKLGGGTVGVIALASLYEHRCCSAKTVDRLRAMAEIFGSGLQRKRAVAEILHLRHELTYLSRVTMMGQLAASLAHELNQPLGAILNNAEAMQAILVSDRPDLEELRAGIADIIQDDNRAQEIIQRLKTLFRRKEVPKSQIDMVNILGEIGPIVRGEGLRRNVSLKIDVKQPLPLLLADSVQLQQAIINLILNAFDAVATVDDGPREVRIEAMAQGEAHGIKLLVRDTGAGIAPDAISRIFEPFFTTKPNGMGMGLAIAKSIIDAHGGTLSVTPNRDRGTTFEIKLPAATEDVS
jgi:signal transduction histidine kinase